MRTKLITTTVHPAQGEQRIAFLDELRGFAVLGMLLVNIVAFGLPVHAAADPSLASVVEVIDKAAFAFTNLFVEGAFRTIFCVLFGVGVLLQFERISEENGPEHALALHRRRMRWLVVFGLVNAYVLLWFGDILFLYGLVGLFLLAFRGLPPSRLLLIAAALLLLLALQNFLFGEYLADSQNQIISIEPKELQSRTAESAQAQMLAEIEEERAAVSAGYLSAWPSRALLAIYMVLMHIGRGLWEVLALMLIGMALYKWDAQQPRLATPTYANIAIAGLTLGVTVNLWESRQAGVAELPLLAHTLWTYDLGRMSIATAYASLFMLLCKLDWTPRLRRPLAATGRMALSNYLLQSLICLVTFVGFGQFGELRLHQLYLVVAAIWGFQLWFSSFWLNRFRFGPMEWAWRSLVHREPLAYRRILE